MASFTTNSDQNNSYWSIGSNGFQYAPAYNFGNSLGSTGSFDATGGGFLDSLADMGNSIWDRMNKTIGSGENATTGLQLGLNTGLGLLGLWNQNQQWKDQLAEARKQFNFSKSLSQANFMNQGSNFLNQSLFQLEGLKAFNPNAGAERAQNLTAAANQLNNAAQNIGINNAFSEQQNAIAKYNTLAGK